MTFTLENLEFFLLIVVRVSAFILSAPFFSMRNMPVKVKAAITVFFSVILFQVLPYEPLVYSDVIGYAGLILKEAVAGLMLGFMANICTYILHFTGSLIDTEIGLAMVNTLNPLSNIQATVTGNYYTYFVMLLLIISNMHHYIIKAAADTFKIVPAGQVVIRSGSYVIIVRFIVDYFIIGFRIMLPIFAAILLVNVVLGILAKIAPQMNMFVIGIELKLLVGILILLLMTSLLPNAADFIFTEMKEMIEMVTKAISP